MATITEPLRRISLISQKSSRGSSWKDASVTVNSSGSNTTAESSSNSSRPSITESGRRRSSLASFSSLLKKSKRQTLSISEENDPGHPGKDKTDRPQGWTIGERFLNLPAEIHTTILAYLSITELLSFRRISRSCLDIVKANSATITRNALRTSSEGDSNDEECAADFLSYLYPSTFSSTTTDAYFLRTLRRKVLIERQLKVLLTFIQTRVYMLKLTRGLECEHFTPYRSGLRTNLYRPVGHVQHLFEAIRHLILRSHPHHLSPNLTIDLCPTCMSSLDSVIASYPSDLLVPIYQVIQLLILHFRNAVRSPSSVTAFERKLRGWGYGPPPEEHMSQLVLVGGLQELCKIDEMQGSYSRRLSVVKTFTDTLAEAIRINNIAFPDIYKSRSDPVMTPSKLSAVYNGKRKEDLRTDIEARADDQSPLKSLNANLNIITDAMLASAPRLDAIIFGPNTPLARRIKKENLIEDESELLTPYKFVTKTMAESYTPDDIRMARPEARNDVSDFDGFDHHHTDPGSYGGFGGHGDAGGSGG